MKIVLINNLYGEYARGGAERAVKIIAEELVRQKHEVAVVSTCPFNKLQACLSGRQVTSNNNGDSNTLGVMRYELCVFNLISYYNLHKLPMLLRLLWHAIDMFNVQSYFKIRKILQIEKPDLVITHNLTGVGFLTPLAIKSVRAKHIHTLHDIQLLHPSGLMLVGQENKVNSLTARIYQWINKKLFSSVDAVVSPSQWLMNVHTQKNFFVNSKKVVLANPIMRNAPACRRGRECGMRPPAGEAGNAEYGNSQGKFIFLYVGQIEKHKGVELLLEAFVDLKDDKCELWIAGEGNINKMLNDECRMKNTDEKIKFVGKKSSTEVRELMQKANCLVVPSLCYENQPTVIMEAKQNNLLVIASDIGGIPEILGTEFLFKAGDRESLKNKMQGVIDNYQTFKIEEPKLMSTQDYIDKIFKL